METMSGGVLKWRVVPDLKGPALGMDVRNEKSSSPRL